MQNVIDSLARIFDKLDELDTVARDVSQRLVRLETQRDGDSEAIARIDTRCAEFGGRLDVVERDELVRSTQIKFAIGIAGAVGAVVGAVVPTLIRLAGAG